MARFPDQDRRTFLKLAGLTGAGLLSAPERILADPYAPLALPGRAGAPVRVRGRVRSGGRGLGGVAVTDGRTVVDTDAEGRFELVSSVRRPFVSVTVPSGYRIPRNPTGTARHYRPIQPDARGEAEAVFDLEPSEGDDRHVALLLPDIQTETAEEMAWFHERTVPDVQATVAGLGGREAFGIACGDIMFDDLTLFPDFERGVARMGVPFFQVVGNHDLDFDNGSDEGSIRTFHRHFGPGDYSFDRGAVHYVVMDDVLWHGAGYIGYLAEGQLRWLEQDLARVEPGRPVIVAIHIPAVGTRHARERLERPGHSGSVTNRERLYRLLEPYEAHILCGHTHENDHNRDYGPHEHVSGTVCGAWWSGPICADGTPSGYSVYEVDGEEVTWRYKATGQADDHQMRLYPAGSDPLAPDEVVANVWDWDDAWTVVWYENGERRGEMARRVGTDPLSEELHRGETLPEHRSWVDPYPTRHLFYAPADPRAREVRVEATDRFGRVYTEVLRGGRPGG